MNIANLQCVVGLVDAIWLNLVASDGPPAYVAPGVRIRCGKNGQRHENSCWLSILPFSELNVVSCLLPSWSKTKTPNSQPYSSIPLPLFHEPGGDS